MTIFHSISEAAGVLRFTYAHPSNEHERARAVLRAVGFDVEGHELEVLRGCAWALADRRIGLIQLEWNTMSQVSTGIDRRPVADLLAAHGYRLYRPDPAGRLVPLADPACGSDVFARSDGPGRGR